MRRLICIILVILLLFSITGCNKKNESPVVKTETQVVDAIILELEIRAQFVKFEYNGIIGRVRILDSGMNSSQWRAKAGTTIPATLIIRTCEDGSIKRELIYTRSLLEH